MASRLQAIRLEVSSPQFGAAALQIYSLVPISLTVNSPVFGPTDPRVWHLQELELFENKPIMKSLFTNLNDEHEFTVAPANLVGNSRDERGPAQHVQVVGPLTLGNQVLYIDVEALLQSVMETISDLQDQVDALNQQLIEQRWIG